MNHLKIIFFLIFLPVVAKAQTQGCFVGVSDNGKCHNGKISCYPGSTSASDNLANYGLTVASLCEDYKNAYEKSDQLVFHYQSLLSDYNALVNKYNSLVSEHNSLVVDFNTGSNYYKALQSDYNSLKAQSDSLKAQTDNIRTSYTGLSKRFAAQKRKLARWKLICGSNCK